MRKRVSYIVHIDVEIDPEGDPEEDLEEARDFTWHELQEKLQEHFDGTVHQVKFGDYYTDIEHISDGLDFGDPPKIKEIAEVSAISTGYEFRCVRCDALNTLDGIWGRTTVIECSMCRQEHNITDWLDCEG